MVSLISCQFLVSALGFDVVRWTFPVGLTPRWTYLFYLLATQCAADEPGTVLFGLVEQVEQQYLSVHLDTW